MSTRTNVTQDAAVRLMLKYPFWSELYYTMTVFSDNTIPTLATDGFNLWVNEEFWRGLSLDLKISAVAHEIGHKMLLHCTRRGARNPMLWNVAADYVVNGILVDNGFALGAGWLYKAKYQGWATEAVYSDLEDELMKEKKDEGKDKKGPKGPPSKDKGEGAEGDGGDNSDSDGGEPSDGSDEQEGMGGASPGDDEGVGGDDGKNISSDPSQVPSSISREWIDKHQDIKELTGSNEAIDKAEKQIIEQVQKAVQTAMQHGNCPAGMAQFDDLCEPSKEPWFNHLHRYMQSLTVAEYNWAKMNRRTMVVHNIFAPEHYSESLGEVVIAIDASGSVFDAYHQANFAGHTQAILSEAKPSKVHVMYFDSDITSYEVMDACDLEFRSKPCGGGGTCFEPIFDKIEEEGIAPAVVIILTDCMGSFPNEEPPYPVIWASIEEHLGCYAPPFGEVLYVS